MGKQQHRAGACKARDPGPGSSSVFTAHAELLLAISRLCIQLNLLLPLHSRAITTFRPVTCSSE